MANYDSFLFIGHGQTTGGGFDPGATGNGKREYDMAKELVNRAKTYLSPLGLNIQYGEQNFNNNLTKNNDYKAKWGMTIHLNSGGGGDGGNAYYTSGCYAYYSFGAGGGNCYTGGVENWTMVPGNQSMNSPTGTAQTGHAGNGHVRITYLG